MVSLPPFFLPFEQYHWQSYLMVSLPPFFLSFEQYHWESIWWQNAFTLEGQCLLSSMLCMLGNQFQQDVVCISRFGVVMAMHTNVKACWVFIQWWRFLHVIKISPWSWRTGKHLGVVTIFLAMYHPNNMLCTSQGWICADNCAYRHTEVELADWIYCLTQLQCTEAGQTVVCDDRRLAG